MSSKRKVLAALILVLVAVIVQTGVLARFRIFGVAPDLVLLAVILLAHTVQPIAALLIGFTGGLAFDLTGNTALGLRALVCTVVAYLAIRTRQRTEVSYPALGVAVVALSLGGVLLLLLVSTLFGQSALSGGGLLRRVSMLPLYNLALAAALFPFLGRWLREEPRH